MDLEHRLDAVVERALTDRRLVGADIAVSQHGKTLYRKAHGLMDREAGRPMVQNAIFRLSSVTKPVIATTILAMADAGLLRLDDAVTEYLPDFRPALPDGTRPAITLTQLLTHTSGLGTDSLTTPADIAAGVDPWHLPTDQILGRIAAQPLLFSPGTGWRYGPSIDVLGALAGKILGGKPEDAARRFVLDPLGMVDTRFSVTDPDRLATPYADGKDGPDLMQPVHTIVAPWGGTVTYTPGRIFDPRAFQSGGGGMAGTADDIMKLFNALQADGVPILRPETAKLALGNATPQLKHAVEPGWQFSLIGAWLDDPAMAGSVAPRGISRWGGIYGHCWLLDPVTGMTLVSMTNTGLEGSDGIYRDEIRRALYAE